MRGADIAIFIVASLIGSALVSYVMLSTSRQESREKQLERELMDANRRIGDLEALTRALQTILLEQQQEMSDFLAQQVRSLKKIRELEVDLASYRPIDIGPRLRKLRAAQFKTLREAIGTVFTSSELKNLLSNIGQDMQAITRESGTYEDQVADVVTRANREGWLDRLLSEMIRARPQRPDFVLLAQSLEAEL